ncbi:ribonuclease HI family protein [Patescibacteria group bacterium]|nr:ribonuclease HI family protein [Patescibacteria group bacterium]
MKLIVYTDGGARGNPGPAAIGVVIRDSSGKIIKKEKRCIGDATNNFAEYQAVIHALEHAKELGGTELEFFLDSELVVKQLNGEYRVRDAGLAAQFLKLHNLRTQFKKTTFKHVRRENNKEADALVNEALDKR